MPYPKQKSETYNASGGINVKASVYATAENEQLDILNMDFRVPGSLTKRFGSTSYIGASVAGIVGGIYEFTRLSGSSYLIVTANTNAYTINTGNFVAFRSNLLNNGIFDFVPFVDRLFMANGQNFFKTDGVNSSFYSLPPGQSTPAFGVTGAVGGGLSGIFIASYGYLNDRGYFGPVSQGITVSLNGITFGSFLYHGMTTPAGYGITALAFYRTDVGQFVQYGTTIAPISATFVDNAPLSFTRQAPEYLWFTMAPKYLELFNNQLFLAGFSSMPSTAYWSDIGEPEGVLPESFAEFRTNDGDRITGMKTYSNTLVVTKERSVLRLSGDDPSNFAIQEVSDQFGCISNRAMVVYNDVMEWLDTKGVVQYNGANIAFTSNRVENIFLRMNLVAARERAQAIHFRDLNEVWWAIPVDGSTQVNAVVVHDYLVDAWTVYKGFNPASLAVILGRFEKSTVLYGNYGGQVFNFGASLMGDNGAGITCSVQARYLAPMGQSMEQQFRRFYLNVDPIIGVTQAISVNLRPNYGASIAASYTMYQNPFQSRIDFGVPAVSLSPEVIQVSATLPFKVNGWTMESRFQRAVAE
jgi:hypothetical protein